MAICAILFTWPRDLGVGAEAVRRMMSHLGRRINMHVSEFIKRATNARNESTHAQAMLANALMTSIVPIPAITGNGTPLCAPEVASKRVMLGRNSAHNTEYIPAP